VRAAGADAREVGDVVAALEAAAELCPSDGLIVVAGSLFVAGEALQAVGATGDPRAEAADGGLY